MSETATDGPAFAALIGRVATAWSDQNTDAALRCFTDDAVYMQPPDVQLFVGHAELRPYFDALTEGTILTVHHVAFDIPTQIGMAEFSFGHVARQTADVGVAVIAVRRQRIHSWREYVTQGPAEFGEFISPERTTFQWHIGNYP